MQVRTEERRDSKESLGMRLRRGMTIRLENISCDVDNDSDEANKSWKEFYLNKRAALPTFLLPKVSKVCMTLPSLLTSAL